jgi:hypothetical protein
VPSWQTHAPPHKNLVGNVEHRIADPGAYGKRRGEDLAKNYAASIINDLYRGLPDAEHTPDTLKTRAFLIKSIGKMAVECQFFIQDGLTTANELTEYLSLR